VVNWIWLGMIAISFVAAAANGRMDELAKAAFDGAQTGVTVCFGLISVLVFWMGLMRVGEDAGLLRKLAVLLGPVVRRLFPDVPKDHPALGYIMSNMSANLLGLGNAATPMGIRAMQELQKLNPDPTTATPAMCTLLAINTSSITLVPTTLIAIRMNYGSANPAEIVGTTIAATAIATGAALLADRWYRGRAGRPPRLSAPPADVPPAGRAAGPRRPAVAPPPAASDDSDREAGHAAGAGGTTVPAPPASGGSVRGAGSEAASCRPADPFPPSSRAAPEARPAVRVGMRPGKSGGPVRPPRAEGG